MPRAGSHAELLGHIRQFVNSACEPAPDDFNGVVHLMLAAFDNLRHNALGAELEDIKGSFSEGPAAFFLILPTTSGGVVPSESHVPSDPTYHRIMTN